jgi:hypothetical protein
MKIKEMGRIYNYPKFSVNGRSVALSFAFDQKQYSYNRLNFDFLVFQSKLLNKLTDESLGPEVKKIKEMMGRRIFNHFDVRSPEDQARLTQKLNELSSQIDETVETDLEKKRLMENIGVSYKEIAGKNCPPFTFFVEKTVGILGDFIKEIFTTPPMSALVPPLPSVKTPELIEPGQDADSFKIKVLIGNASWEEEENIAIVDEKMSTPSTIYLGFHGAYIARYIVFPIYLSNGKKYFKYFLQKAILHELQHYTQLPRTRFEFKVVSEEMLRGETQGILTPSRGILFYCLFELMKEAEAYWVETKRLDRRGFKVEWITQFKKLLTDLVSAPMDYPELYQFYKDKIDVKEMLYFNALLMMIFISFAIAKSRNDGGKILLYRSNGTRFKLEEMDKVMKEEKGLYIGGIPEPYFDLTMQSTSSRMYVGFIRLYDEACNSLKISEQNRIVDLKFYRELVKRAKESDKRFTKMRDAKHGF